MKHEDAPEESTDSIVVECDLDEPPEKVWHALTEPELLAQWLHEPAANDVECEVLEAEPNHLLRYSWRGGENDRDADGRALDTVVTFVLTETVTGGTHLRVEHSGFDADADRAEPLPQLEETTCALATGLRSRIAPRSMWPATRARHRTSHSARSMSIARIRKAA